jgi:hypothetical protein
MKRNEATSSDSRLLSDDELDNVNGGSLGREPSIECWRRGIAQLQNAENVRGQAE